MLTGILLVVSIWPLLSVIIKYTLYDPAGIFVPLPNVLVVGEVVADNQGWTEGALDSVVKVVTKKSKKVVESEDEDS